MNQRTAPSSSEPRTLVTHPELRSHQSLPAFKTLGEPPKNVLERLLSFFADVRAGEGAGALLLTLNVFLLLAGYYLLKPAREALILTEGNAGDRVLLGGRTGRPADGRRAALRLARHRACPDPPDLHHDAAVFCGEPRGFSLLGRSGVREGMAFYIWLGIFNVFIVSQFWAFANDLYTEGQGRRLFPLIGVGAVARRVGRRGVGRPAGSAD